MIYQKRFIDHFCPGIDKTKLLEQSRSRVRLFIILFLAERTASCESDIPRQFSIVQKHLAEKRLRFPLFLSSAMLQGFVSKRSRDIKISDTVPPLGPADLRLSTGNKVHCSGIVSFIWSRITKTGFFGSYHRSGWLIAVSLLSFAMLSYRFWRRTDCLAPIGKNGNATRKFAKVILKKC